MADQVVPDLEEAPGVGGEEHGEPGGRPGRSRQPGRGRVHRQDRVHAEILIPHLSQTLVDSISQDVCSFYQKVDEIDKRKQT